MQLSKRACSLYRKILFVFLLGYTADLLAINEQDFEVSLVGESWATILKPNIQLRVKNISPFMLAIDEIEVEFPGADVPLKGTFYRDADDNDELIEPDGDFIYTIEEVEPLDFFSWGTLIYRSKPIRVQFEFHPGGAQRWISDTFVLEMQPSAPFYSVLLGGFLGVGVLLLLVYLLESTKNLPLGLTVKSFFLGSLVAFLTIFVLRMLPTSPLGGDLQRAGFIAVDIYTGFYIGLSTLVILPIIKLALSLYQPSNAG